MCTFPLVVGADRKKKSKYDCGGGGKMVCGRGGCSQGKKN